MPHRHPQFFVGDNDVKFVKLTFCDIFGNQKKQSLFASELPPAFEQGISFDNSSIAGSPWESMPRRWTAACRESLLKCCQAIAAATTWHASFMPKPLHDQSGNGLHVNMSLVRDGKNLLKAT